MSWFDELYRDLDQLGVSKPVFDAQKKTGVKCGVALGLLAPGIIKKAGGRMERTYSDVFGNPILDGQEAPLHEDMERLRQELVKNGLL